MKNKLLNCYIVKLLPKSSGQTLIEVIVAIVIAAVVLVALTSIILSSYVNVNYSESQVNASSLAQQAMDFIHNLHDTNYSSYKSYVSAFGSSQKYCLDQTNTTLTSCFAPYPILKSNGASYQRTISLLSGTSQCPVAPSADPTTNIQITVTVAWQDRKCPLGNAYCYQSQLVTCLSDANIPPAI